MYMKGERITSRQKQQRIRTNEILEALNIKGSTLSRWKNNINEPDDETKLKLAEFLNTTVAYLMGEIDDPSPRVVLVDKAVPSENLFLSVERSGKKYAMEDIEANPNLGLPNKIDSHMYRMLPGGLVGIGDDIVLVPRLTEQYSPHCGGVGFATYQDGSSEGEYEPTVLRLLGSIDEAKPPRAYKVTGSSMVDYGIPPDTWIIINPAEFVSAGTICLVEIGGNPVIKKIYPKGDGIELLASNGQKIYADKEDIDCGYIKIIGKVVSIQGIVDHRP